MSGMPPHCLLEQALRANPFVRHLDVDQGKAPLAEAFCRHKGI
jgi:hypothetical protein